MRLRAIVYARVSTTMQEDNESLKYQTQKGQDYCDLRNYEVYKLISDVGSGGKFDRKGYQQLLREIEERTFDILVVFETSRIARDTRELLNFVFKLNEKEIKFSSISQPELDTSSPTGKLFFNIQASLAEYERKQTSIRVKSNKKARAKEGNWQGGFLPMGYKKNENNDIIIDEKKSEIVKMYFEEYKNGASIKEISSRYNINLSSLIYILQNKFYLGLLPYGKRENNIDTNSVKIKKDFKYIFKGNHEALIDKETFEKVAERLKKRHRTTKSNTEILMFSSLVRCQCGGRMFKSTTRGYHSYKCDKCKKSISEIKLNQKIIEELFKITELQKLNEVKKEDRGKEFIDKIENIKKERKESDKQLKELLKLLLKKIITEKEYLENKNEIENRMNYLNNEIIKYEKLIEIENSKFCKNDNINLLRTVILNVDDTEKKELNEIFKMLISEIKIIDNKKLSMCINLSI